MKTKRLVSTIGFVLLVFSPTIWAAGHGGGGGGGGFGGGGGHFGGGGGFRSGPAIGGGARFSFGARPVYGRPVSVRPATPVTSSAGRLTSLSHQRDSVSSVDRNANRNSRSPIATNSQRPMESARNHTFARQDASAHRDWDRRSAHHWNGHWWCWDGGAWIGLDAGYYPWDFYPYYAYDYYPYDYYPGYYSDVEPYYSNNGVSDVVPAADPTVTAVQQDLANMGYYSGAIDGLYGQATRDAVARYQSAKKIAVTGTLTTQTLQSLGVSATNAS